MQSWVQADQKSRGPAPSAEQLEDPAGCGVDVKFVFAAGSLKGRAHVSVCLGSSRTG